MSGRPVIALDVGGSTIKSALVVGDHLLDEPRVDLVDSGGSAESILHMLAAIIDAHGISETRGVAFAFPGPFDYAAGVCLMQHLAKFDALYGIDVGSALRQILHAPSLEFRYRNDAQAAVLGEAVYGVGKAYRRLLGLTLGTGLGSAFVADGSLIIDGADVPPDGWLYPLDYLGQRADDVFSTRGLLARLQVYGIEASDVTSAIKIAGDHPALHASFGAFGAALGQFIEPHALRFGAQAIVIVGGIAETWERFAPTLIQSVSVPVRRGTLGRSAALLGAADLYALA